MKWARGFAVVASVALVAAAVTLVVACEDDPAYAYIAQPYDPTFDCIGIIEVVDVEEGLDPGETCTPLCLAGDDIDGSIDVYISTMCGPTPFGVDVSGSNPQCVPALAAFARAAYCLDAGGSSNPIDASAAFDASATDAVADTVSSDVTAE